MSIAARPWRLPLRLAAIAAGVVLPLLATGTTEATLPGPPLPIPASGQPITVVVEPPSVATLTVPVTADNCAVDMSYNNKQANPAGTIFRGQTACGSAVWSPGMSGSATLTDPFGNVVAVAQPYSGTGNGPFTAAGDFLVGSGGVLAQALDGAGAVPGLDYMITYTSSITLASPQYWGPAPAGCTVSGQTMTCVATTRYDYIPGTAGGISPG